MNFLKSTTLAIAFFLLNATNAFALPVTFNANSSYGTSSDSVYVMFIDRLNNNGDVIDKIRLDLKLDGTFNTGNLNAGVFNTVSLNSTLLSASATDLDTNTALQTNLTGNLSFNYQNTLRNPDGSAIAQVGSTTGQNGTLTLTGTLDNKTFSTNIAISAMAGTKDSVELVFST
jgi:hypothetical protein